MALMISPVRSKRELKEFVTFPWRIYRDNPCWVPPLINDRMKRLDPQVDPFWKNARRELWIARLEGRPVGTIAGIVEEGRVHTSGAMVGSFGFFECIDDTSIGQALLDTVADWLRGQGMTVMRGPFNPSGDDECGFLVEGFQTRPAVLEGHSPPYYAAMVERLGFTLYREMVARMLHVDNRRTFEEQVPAKLLQVAERVRRRADLSLRTIDMRRWDEEIIQAWHIYVTALSELPEYVPITLADFQALAASFRPILNPQLAQIAEVGGKPVGFALAIPDANEALQHVNGRLGPLGLLKLLWYSRRLKRVSFKILMMLPEYQGRGVEAALTIAVARAIWDAHYQEVDMSMTGSENVKSNRLQENLGFQVYRRYRIYEKAL